MKTPRSLLTATCVAVCLCLAAAAMAQQPTAAPETKQPAGAPQTQPAAAAPQGQAVLSTVTVTATVTKINQKTREVTVKDTSGKVYSFVADPAVKNLAQVKVGDVVTATYTEALAYVVKKEGVLQSSTAQGVATAAPGEKPAGVAGSTTTVTVMITAIDPKVPSVTFKGPQGNTRTIKVKDPSRLEGVNVGDKVDITYTEALAVKVEAAPKKK
jgi:glucose/arabinose dehydrogenase